ncbi:non-heme ferritin [Neisseria sp. Dent CA1/247]|uniref:Ferritin n=1 Tax=Neisseria zoodegmatis TaxID=326523 RepID=A0AB38DPX6_9NEIS|nr:MULTISPECIES: non-heme ferritin [Neisseria]MDO5070204.1 non-heme ferritin [Neisseria zoodegmatis]OSI09753.1 ferritin [Neisseria zoodegmatis]UOO76299.1 non-heme ferritin [Neisseria sp. Dent CA1/247]SNU79465.1 Probable ferritin-1 [Neisseria zoodegmatis]
MLSEKIVKHLNEQLNLEFYSSNVYLQMSAWADSKGFEGAAAFLKAHAAEEMQHMHRLFDYLSETGAMPEIGTIPAPKTNYKGLKEMFEAVYKHEKTITKKINELVEATFTEKDYSSFNFLQWYVSEQHEEERLFKSILDKINLVGDDGKGLYHVDKDLAGLATAGK